MKKRNALIIVIVVVTLALALALCGRSPTPLTPVPSTPETQTSTPATTPVPPKVAAELLTHTAVSPTAAHTPTTAIAITGAYLKAWDEACQALARDFGVNCEQFKEAVDLNDMYGSIARAAAWDAACEALARDFGVDCQDYRHLADPGDWYGSIARAAGYGGGYGAPDWSDPRVRDKIWNALWVAQGGGVEPTNEEVAAVRTLLEGNPDWTIEVAVARYLGK
jgi:hypothetical protein